MSSILDEKTIEINGKLISVGDKITYTILNKEFSGKLVEFRIVDPKDMASLWVRVLDDKEIHWISSNVIKI